MLQSKLFTKTKKDTPSDEISKNAQLLLRAGFIEKEMAGVYTFLPLGLKVLNNIIEVIRREMNNIGGQEIYLSALQDIEL
jgi:prolyl-tRNA synthetase